MAKNLRISELDFDAIKANLKTFLRSQSEFTDYDFEGSGLAVLLDVLAYNTHYNAYLANMVVNEMFIDSAVKRSSVTSIAKHLGYTPRSTTGAIAKLNITVNSPTGNPASLTLNRYSPFVTTVNGSSYTFLTTDTYTIQPTNGAYTFSNISVKEGTLLEYSYTAVTPGVDEKYEIPNAAVDTSTLLVTVQTSSTDSTFTTYTQATDILNYTGASTVYFLEESPLGNYQIYFGDGIIGKQLTAGSIIRIQYLTCQGSVVNVSGKISQTFAASGSIGGSSNIVVATVANSTGGAEREGISSIRINAPRAYLARNRAVTKADYSALIKAHHSQVEAINVWGGEENNPPAYGKVFISLKPYEGHVIDANTRNIIKNDILRERQVLTITPEFVEPDYIYVNLIADVKYSRNQTTASSSDISVLARTSITNYFTNNLQQFENPFYYSQILEDINNAHTSIISTLLKVRLQKRINPALNLSNAYIDANTIRFNNKLHPAHLESTRFFVIRNNQAVMVRIKDIPIDTSPAGYNKTGDVRLYAVSDNTDLGSIGSINYATGVLTITNIVPVGYPSGQYEIVLTCDVQESNYDVTAAKNQIIIIDDNTENISINRLAGLTINVTAV